MGMDTVDGGNNNANGLASSVLDFPFAQHTKDAICAEFWDSLATTGQRLQSPSTDLDKYWAYYYKECSSALHDGGRHVATRSHSDVVDCVRKLRQGMLRDDIKTALSAKLSAPHANQDEMLDNSIDLAASLLLMASFGSFSYGFSGRSRICWSQGSLSDFLGVYFEPDDKSAARAHDSIKLEKIFKASNLDRIAGLEVVWTDNIVDHLRMTDDDTRVHIFHHASFLELQRQNPGTLLPEGLAEETLQTLAVLFPSSDRETKQWFAKLPPGDGRLDARILHCGRLKTDDRQIDRFKFWRDRLVMLKEVFDEAQPRTISQWWYDRRNGVQWYTFWVAVLVLVLTVVFGLVQSIEGGMQVYYSAKALTADGGGAANGGAG
ncbi:hypothetical protein B0T24DRAFT_632406 [Lasiosphaeria ovina]|uniref:Uncharacterized protein n=1 Tax=Lasiosphaeria ovina TaxID=92902 RepID=A0AAE0N3B4_9PEZI|nr:hypothetical protein B0T24DRAFT_632406 [Lasiosphaeria ovina]